MSKGGSVILRIYFALVSFVTLMILVVSAGDLINLGLKTWVFPAADQPAYVAPCPTPVAMPDGKPAVADQAVCEQQRAEQQRQALVQKEQNAVRDLSFLLVAAPLFALHFRIVLRDWKELRNENA